jgi:hypothetical protein
MYIFYMAAWIRKLVFVYLKMLLSLSVANDFGFGIDWDLGLGFDWELENINANSGIHLYHNRPHTPS